ncbi:glycosyltransferase family protein [Terrabacter terrigena]|uniref:Glycosyltransferase RgtA/B/C/D-like domain-containing protein n=1 Tax=Terrabacter terrigena TaxID=574718 RepID=A0ABW3MYH9_9MICO
MTSSPPGPEGARSTGFGGQGVLSTTCMTLAALVATGLSAARLVPSPQGDDHGTYASVAERLLGGDRLYTDVWDNKDPVFYYALALGRLVSPLADYAVEILWALVACAAAWSLSRTAGLGRSRAALLAALTPVVLTGPAYVPGMTHLPGVALTLGAVAAAVRRRWVLAGAVTAIILLTKITLAPVAVVGLLTCAWHHRSVSGGVRAALGGLAALGTGIGVLTVRDELGGWVLNLRANLLYADGELFSSRYGGPVGHLLRAFPEGSPRTALVVVVAVVAVVVLAGVPAWREQAPRSSDGTGADLGVAPLLGWLVVSTLVASLVVLAATATWPHHGQTLGVPAVTALVLAATRLNTSVAHRTPGGARRGGTLAPLAAVLVTAYALGGALHPTFYVQAARSAPRALAALAHESPASTALRSLPQVRTYARAGSNDTSAHALGLRGLELACPRFHQYSIEPADILDETATCLPSADAIIVDDSLRPEEGAPDWNSYVARVRGLVAASYDCLRSTGAQVCVRRAG